MLIFVLLIAILESCSGNIVYILFGSKNKHSIEMKAFIVGSWDKRLWDTTCNRVWNAHSQKWNDDIFKSKYMSGNADLHLSLDYLWMSHAVRALFVVLYWRHLVENNTRKKQTIKKSCCEHRHFRAVHILRTLRFA